MPVGNENTNPPIPASPSPPLSPSPAGACPPAAIGASPPPAAAPRPPKSAVLPEVARLALEGFSGRAIGRRLGVPPRTIERWLQELRQEWARRAEEDAAQLVPVTLARLELAYREAMEAWRRSLDDKETTSETCGRPGAAAEKSCVRRTTQSGQAALLRTVIHAAKEVYAFQAGHLARRSDAEAAEAQRVREAEAAEAERVRAAEAAEARRVREEIAGELLSQDGPDLDEVELILAETSWATEARDPEELAQAINDLPGEEYPRLREHCLGYRIELPFRRTTPWRANRTTTSPNLARAGSAGATAAEIGATQNCGSDSARRVEDSVFPENLNGRIPQTETENALLEVKQRGNLDKGVVFAPHAPLPPTGVA